MSLISKVPPSMTAQKQNSTSTRVPTVEVNPALTTQSEPGIPDHQKLSLGSDSLRVNGNNKVNNRISDYHKWPKDKRFAFGAGLLSIAAAFGYGLVRGPNALVTTVPGAALAGLAFAGAMTAVACLLGNPINRLLRATVPW